jgi:hypothetical protein
MVVERFVGAPSTSGVRRAVSVKARDGDAAASDARASDAHVRSIAVTILLSTLTTLLPVYA